MGNCCESALDKNNVTVSVGKRPQKYCSGFQPGEDTIIDQVLDDRMIAGRVGEGKIELIVRI